MSDPVASFSATGPEVESIALQTELTAINLSDLERLIETESLLDTSRSLLDTSGSLLDTSGAPETINLSHLAAIIQVDTATISCNTINPIAAAAQDLIVTTAEAAVTAMDSDLFDGENELENEPAARHKGVMTCKVASHLKMRVFDKLNCCFVCDKLLKVKVTRHLTTVQVNPIKRKLQKKWSCCVTEGTFSQ